jgi:aspartyl-tRNA(Asn)/glutamyl-tRNA(Gln) amidotransferase subunit A
MLTSGECTCRELTLRYLAAIDSANADLAAYISVTRETALATADAVDAKLRRGERLAPLEGVPFSLKDNISTRGLETSCASNMLAGYKPAYDAFTWELLKARNAVLLGKANMDEFAMGSTCETSRIGGAKNPHNIGYVSGGSSGGSASSVAANLAAYSLGSDTGGSVRQPAAFCGLLGLKPTYGAVSRRGLIAFASSLDQIGILAEDSDDARAVFQVIAKPDALDMTSRTLPNLAPELNRTIGVASEFFTGVSPDVEQAVRNAIDTFERLGYEIVPVEFPLLRYVLPTYYILACAEASSNLGRYDGIRYGFASDMYDDIDDGISRVRSEGFGAEVKRRIMLGTYVLSSGYFDAYYKKAQDLRHAIKRQIEDNVFGRCGMLLTPTVPTNALKIGANLSPVEIYGTDICTVTANIAELPAVSVPCGNDSAGLPIGVQLIGSAFSDAALLDAAADFERATDREFVANLDMGVRV